MSNLPEAFPAAKIIWVKAPVRSAENDNKPVAELVAKVLADVKARGDAAVRQYAREFDKADLQVFEVSMAQREAAVTNLAPQTRKDSEFAIANVRRFAEAQLATILPLDIEALPGVFMGHRVIPIERVGCYVPGGRFPLLSAPIMTIVPAKVAGVPEVIACLPPNAHEAMVAGCHLSGADRIFRIGGAQAIAAMAFGTETVPAVMKIMGPGNAFVNEAKKQVFGHVGIDQLAGPSEIYILAPVWNTAGDQIATRFQQPNQDYLTAYNLDGNITLPILPIPLLRGLDWRTIRIAKLPVTFQKSALLTPTALIKSQTRFDTPIPNKRASVVQLNNVKAPHPFLHDAVDEAFIALRQRVITETGWDSLASLADAYEPLTSTLDPGKGEDWLYTGRAFSLNPLTLNVGWMQVIREEINGQTYWRVYLRALAQDGSQGEPLPGLPWDLNARYNLDPQSYDQGGVLMQSIPAGYWVDFTNLANQYGWQRIAAQNNWRTYFTGMRPFPTARR